MKIVIGGSMQFADQMITIHGELKKLGHTPFMSSFTGEYSNKATQEVERLKLRDKYEKDAIKEFWKLMKPSDALLILNYDKNGIKNYIGGNAFLDIGFAYALEQKIYLLNPIPDMPYYGTEIIAMRPIVINGDLSKIEV